MQKWQIELKKGFAKPLILLLLAEKESYAYQLTKSIRDRTKYQIEVATSNIYPMLKNLLDDRLIEKIQSSDTKRTDINKINAIIIVVESRVS